MFVGPGTNGDEPYLKLVEPFLAGPGPMDPGPWARAHGVLGIFPPT